MFKVSCLSAYSDRSLKIKGWLILCSITVGRRSSFSFYEAIETSHVLQFGVCVKKECGVLRVCEAKGMEVLKICDEIVYPLCIKELRV